MSVSENPYASPSANSVTIPTKDESRELDLQLAEAKRLTRLPAWGMLVCSVASALLVLFPIGLTTLLGIQGFPTPWLGKHIIAYWYLYLTPYVFYFAASFFGSLSLLKCQNRLLARIGCISSVVPLVTPLFPISIPFGVLGLAALKKPEVQEVLRRTEYDERSNRSRALAKLFAPASILLMMECVTLLTMVLPFATWPFVAYYLDPQLQEDLVEVMARGPAIRILIVSVGAGFVSYSVTQMLRGRQYVICVTGACVAMLPFLTPCIFFGIPFGLWALVILLQKDTRAAFAEANHPS